MDTPEKKNAMQTGQENNRTASSSSSDEDLVTSELIAVRPRDGGGNSADGNHLQTSADKSEGPNPIVQALARCYHQSRSRDASASSSSTTSSSSKTTATDIESLLDPSSPSFEAQTWAEAVVSLFSSPSPSPSSPPTPSPFRTAGVLFQNLSVYGFGTGADYQKDVANVWLSLFQSARSYISPSSSPNSRIQILDNFNGLLRRGEMLVVLGPPGSGCSTLLKTIAGDLNGISTSQDAYFNYQGLSYKEMHTHHRGEAIYTAEQDVHFPMMNVGDTLTFAARARQPRHLPPALSQAQATKESFAGHLRDVVTSMFGISHTLATPVGNDLIRGISGGERKRLSICEAALSGAALQCWDNSTRGLDSANAIELCRNLRLSSDVFGTASAVSIYQAPQPAYDLFDKVTVLYEGCQIFFGGTKEAKAYFEGLGFDCPVRQTTPDFLTSMTSPKERLRCVREGWEDKVPRTPNEFVTRWKQSSEYQQLQKEMEDFKREHPLDGPDALAFRGSKHAQQAKMQRVKSPFMLSYPQQVKLCLWRGWRRLKGDPSLTVGALIGNFILALIVGSVFYNLQETTSSFFQRGALIFFACLLNAFSSALEILTLFAQRPIVEKHSRYALYHPSAEAISSMICDLPFKITNAITFNLCLYFMTNLRREPSAFFFYLLISFSTGLVMSMIFRTIGSASRTLFQALVPAGILMLDLIIFAGFVIPQRYMLPWCSWLKYIDPLAYAFEALIVNEFHDRKFTCDDFIPSAYLPEYSSVEPDSRVCRSVGAKPGQNFVLGDDYYTSQFEYAWEHRWRNYGIIIAFTAVLMCAYLLAAEQVKQKKSRGEVLIYRLGHRKPVSSTSPASDAEAGRPGTAVGPPILSPILSSVSPAGVVQPQATFLWRSLCYDIALPNPDAKKKGQPKQITRRILNRVDGYIRPGTLTALMGVSGAGKTSLLDCLADRPAAIGLVSGEILINGTSRSSDPSFQRKTGYVQQQDLHLPTSTVREALQFSAILRQPTHISREEKLAYVEDVISLLEMEEYADTVVGMPGVEGLNVEQRKHLTIAVELAARPPFLFFVDEPTSGLDSQTSWAILDLLERLTKGGQAILCTIHQPSAVLFQRFDRLLLLASGGKTVYFGEIGEDSNKMIGYFERELTRHFESTATKDGGEGRQRELVPCPPGANPAEWMLQVIGAAPGSKTDVDWFETWRNSDEFGGLQRELDELASLNTTITTAGKGSVPKPSSSSSPPSTSAPALAGGSTTAAAAVAPSFPCPPAGPSDGEFAAPFAVQLRTNLTRVFQQYYRTPTYIYSKLALCTLISLFIGFVFFKSPSTIQGLQSQLFSIFNLFTIFGQIVQQTLPQFIMQRNLYEARERPSKTYGWQVFMLSQILVEIPWNALMGVFMFLCWYYPVGLYANASPEDQSERGLLVFLFLVLFMVFAGTFATFMVSGQETAEAGGNLADLLATLCLIFCGILVTADDLPRFWVFMNKVSPFTYLVGGILGAGIANSPVKCAENEVLTFFTPGHDTSCQEYMRPHIERFGGYLLDTVAGGNTTTGGGQGQECFFCPMSNTNQYLASVNISYGDRWRNFGIVWVYVLFNIAAALFVYWLTRVPKKAKNKTQREVNGGEKEEKKKE